VTAIAADHRVPVSGVTILAIDHNGRKAAQAVSEYDGYVYFDGLPYGSYTLTTATGQALGNATITRTETAPKVKLVVPGTAG
jgi:hypothetical protein